MKVNPQTDELLCGFIDGELSPRQQTEVQRMAARDPDVAHRLQQLQNGRTLINVLPRAEAPADLLEQIQLSLERKILLEERPILIGTRAGARHLKIRRFVAAAAMIALVGVLGAVVYQIVAPISLSPSQPSNWTVAPIEAPMSQPPAPAPAIAAGSPFSGRLELSTASLTQADAFIRASAEDNRLAIEIPASLAGTRAVYRISGPREEVDRLVADLETMGQNLKAARLVVETERFADPIVIDSVTMLQVARIMNQNTTQARVKTAKDIAVLNCFERQMPGREIQIAATQRLDNAIADLSSIPRPRLASRDRNYPSVTTPLEGEAKVKASLTIVLLSTQ